MSVNAASSMEASFHNLRTSVTRVQSSVCGLATFTNPERALTELVETEKRLKALKTAIRAEIAARAKAERDREKNAAAVIASREEIEARRAEQRAVELRSRAYALDGLCAMASANRD